MAVIVNNHDRLYFDKLVRSQKANSILAFIMATYHSPKNSKGHCDRDGVAKRLENAYNLFRDNVRGADSGSGSYTGTNDQFQSQYTLGLEFGVWTDTNLTLSRLAENVAEQSITIKEFLSIALFNYVQPINYKMVNPLKVVFEGMANKELNTIDKTVMNDFFANDNISVDRDGINGLYDLLKNTVYFDYNNHDNSITYCFPKPLYEVVSKFNTHYLCDNGYNLAEEEIGNNQEKYCQYLLKDVLHIQNKWEETKMGNCLDITLHPRTDTTHPLNQILYGAPGTGKTYSTAELAMAIIKREPFKLSASAEERQQILAQYNQCISAGKIVFTTFHQSYGYEEFIQGLRPDTDSSTLSFKTTDGVFKRIADRAMSDGENNYVIIIDEINRGNISKIFGELITLIEEDKRWGELNQMNVTLPSGEVFAVPNNLYIVGTMNSADKSISLIDTALRRRFSFVEQKPQSSLILDSGLKKLLENLNNQLVKDLNSTDLLIGHSYFINKSIDDLPFIFNSSIIPLLYEYYFDNRKKVLSIINSVLDSDKFEVIDDNVGRLRIEEKQQ